MKCQECGKTISKPKEKFCSTSCSKKSYTKRNIEKLREWQRKWRENNREKVRECYRKALAKFRREKPGRFKELMKEQYKKHADKWKSRALTYQLLKAKTIEHNLKNLCKNCGSEENLQLKFEIYPKKSDQIREAITQGKIYNLCRRCRLK